MAAYKAEFLSHHYEARGRPLEAQLMGRIGEWAPLASRFPAASNLLAKICKPLFGIASGRKLPKLASRSFRQSFRPTGSGDPVVLFDDTFTSHFHPQALAAAQRVLGAAGCAAELPPVHVCCGRPYYDYGMLDQAKRALERVLEALPPDRPVVVLEPGCLSVFRDELAQLFPNDERAARLAAQATTLAALLERRGWQPPRLAGQALLHGHCHQKALGGTRAEQALLGAAGLRIAAPDTGCCGMAGAFGYRARHYDASARIFGLALGPALEGAPAAEVVADGFSCRAQITGLAGRTALHSAELLARALESRDA